MELDEFWLPSESVYKTFKNENAMILLLSCGGGGGVVAGQWCWVTFNVVL